MQNCGLLPRHSGAREARTRNLEILRCAIAHHSSVLLDRPGRTEQDRTVAKTRTPGTGPGMTPHSAIFWLASLSRRHIREHRLDLGLQRGRVERLHDVIVHAGLDRK